MCNKSYCQQCLQKCVEDVVELDHRRGCWAKFCGLVAIMIDWTKRSDATTKDYFKTTLIFIFGNHILYSYKYYDFFKKNHIVDNNCVHLFFTYVNVLVNICYCIISTIPFFEFFFLLFFPAIFSSCYYKFIVVNWLIVLDFGVDESPITELTVRGKGYGGYGFNDDHSDYSD